MEHSVCTEIHCTVLNTLICFNRVNCMKYINAHIANTIRIVQMFGRVKLK